MNPDILLIVDLLQFSRLLFIEKCLFEACEPRKKFGRDFQIQARAFRSLEVIY